MHKSNRRTEVVMLRFSPEELEMVNENAEMLKMRRAKYLRFRGLEAIDDLLPRLLTDDLLPRSRADDLSTRSMTKDRQELAKLYKTEWTRQGVNLNQIARGINIANLDNSVVPDYRSNLLEIRDENRKIMEQLQQLINQA